MKFQIETECNFGIMKYPRREVACTSLVPCRHCPHLWKPALVNGHWCDPNTTDRSSCECARLVYPLVPARSGFGIIACEGGHENMLTALCNSDLRVREALSGPPFAIFPPPTCIKGHIRVQCLHKSKTSRQNLQKYEMVSLLIVLGLYAHI